MCMCASAQCIYVCMKKRLAGVINSRNKIMFLCRLSTHNTYALASLPAEHKVPSFAWYHRHLLRQYACLYMY